MQQCKIWFVPGHEHWTRSGFSPAPTKRFNLCQIMWPGDRDRSRARIGIVRYVIWRCPARAWPNARAWPKYYIYICRKSPSPWVEVKRSNWALAKYNKIWQCSYCHASGRDGVKMIIDQIDATRGAVQLLTRRRQRRVPIPKKLKLKNRTHASFLQIVGSCTPSRAACSVSDRIKFTRGAYAEIKNHFCRDARVKSRLLKP